EEISHSSVHQGDTCGFEWHYLNSLCQPMSGFSRTGKVQTLTGHQNKINALAYSTDGTMLVSGGSDQTLRFWNPLTGAKTRILDSHTAPQSLVLTKDKQTLFTSQLYDLW